MEYKHCCVIDKDSIYVDIVVVDLVPDPLTGETIERVQKHVMQEGETLVPWTAEVPNPHRIQYAGQSGFIRPRWDGSGWVEDCNEAEIAAWEAEHPAPDPMPAPKPTPEQEDIRVLKAQVDALTGQADFHEELIVETAGIVYA